MTIERALCLAALTFSVASCLWVLAMNAPLIYLLITGVAFSITVVIVRHVWPLVPPQRR